jgi:YtkA-like
MRFEIRILLSRPFLYLGHKVLIVRVIVEGKKDLEMTPNHKRLPTRWRWIAIGATLIVLILGLSLSQLQGGATPRDQPSPEATPCPSASPTSGTPTAKDATATPCVPTAPVSQLGIPLVVSGITINLLASSDQAGPVNLTVELSDESGAPITGAQVTVSAHSLEMDMGEFPYEAAETEPGHYVADRVAMGMGGDWKVEVDIAIPGQQKIVAYFLVPLEGPK